MANVVFRVGQKVRVSKSICRVSKIVEIVTGSTGKLLYVLLDGGWMDASEIELL